MKLWCLQISQKTNQILDRFLPYEARAEICQNFAWLFGNLKTPNFHSEINWSLYTFIQQSIFQKYAHGTQSSWLFSPADGTASGASYRTFSQQRHGQKEVGNWLASFAWMNLDKNWIISASVPLSTTTGPENVIKRRAKKLTIESAPWQY